MTKVFGDTYAKSYDALYRNKDYEAECTLLERIFHDHADRQVSTILDLGCGTGGHAFPMVRRGYAVTGLERSEEMLAVARSKAANLPDAQRPAFVSGDARRFELGRHFDAAIMMFAVLGYQYENADLSSTLANVARHLADGGLFVFDVWYGPAVLADPPGSRQRTIHTEHGRILRTTSATLDTRRQRCHVHFDLLEINGDRVVAEMSEEHIARFFFPLELDLALGHAGLQLETLRAFPDYDREPDLTSWNVIAVARRNGKAPR